MRLKYSRTKNNEIIVKREWKMEIFKSRVVTTRIVKLTSVTAEFLLFN